MNRRNFIRNSVAAGLAFPAINVSGATQTRKYRTALIGSGWWGMNILRYAMAAGESQVVAMCDVDQNQLNPALEEVRKLSGDQPKKYTDYRELLDKEKPEIVIVATPDHWHPLQTIAAVKAGAHVYVEKPIGHTIKEGRAMVNAARAADRIVQVGTHRRISPHNRSGMEFLKSGKVGDIGMVRTFVHYGGGPGEVTPDSEPPAGLDWNMWCGPAPLRPFNKKIHTRGFRQYLDYANGQLGDWGIHWLDQVLWWTDEKYPKRVSSFGGRFIKSDNTDAPDTQVATYEFEKFVVTWEHRMYAANNAEKTHPQQAVGCYFYGTEGTFHMGWLDGWTFYPSDKAKPIVHEDSKLNEPDQQNIRELWADFVTAIEKKKTPVCDIEVGHRSTNLALLGVLSMKLGRSVRWDGKQEQIIDDPEANQLLRREYRAPWKYPES
ncbi:MAG: Gfo/Idh/MocA family oxidoreductase [Acidobacteriota bacterium]|nr:Gfo/Idh/MocA family oxidoreductase [Acidobacteriota bacterium]